MVLPYEENVEERLIEENKAKERDFEDYMEDLKRLGYDKAKQRRLKKQRIRRW